MKILKFYADWCGPCKQLTKSIEKLKEECSNVEIVPVNVEDNDELSEKYNITTIPVLVKLDDSDTEIDRKIGAISYSELKDFIYKTAL